MTDQDNFDYYFTEMEKALYLAKTYAELVKNNYDEPRSSGIKNDMLRRANRNLAALTELFQNPLEGPAPLDINP